MKSILEYLQKWATKTPDKIFLTDEDEKDWTFSDFYKEAACFSTFLSSMGLKNGSFIIIHLDKKIEHLLTYIALLNIGAISVHLYPENEDEYVKFAASHTNAKAIISNKFQGDINDTLVIKFELKTEFEPTYHSSINDLAYIMFTSGTTSLPKAVMTTQQNVLFVTNTLINLADIKQETEREIILLPLGSTGGLGHFHACLMLGNYARLYPGFYATIQKDLLDNFFDIMEKTRATGVLLTPGLIGEMVYNHSHKLKKSGRFLNYALANVMPMKKEIIQKLLKLLPNLRFCTYYGSTEASRSIVNICRESGEKMHTTGKSAKGIEIKINEANSEIYIRGENVVKGYLHDTKPFLEDGWFKSGDIGKIDKEGFITILGREKEIININGSKIFPLELENAATNLKHIKDIAAFCMYVNEFSKEVCLAVVLDDKNINKESFSTDLLKFFQKYFNLEKTNKFVALVPTRVYFVENIPKTKLGKIKRDDLVAMFEKVKES